MMSTYHIWYILYNMIQFDLWHELIWYYILYITSDIRYLWTSLVTPPGGDGHWRGGTRGKILLLRKMIYSLYSLYISREIFGFLRKFWKQPTRLVSSWTGSMGNPPNQVDIRIKKQKKQVTFWLFWHDYCNLKTIGKLNVIHSIDMVHCGHLTSLWTFAVFDR